MAALRNTRHRCLARRAACCWPTGPVYPLAPPFGPLATVRNNQRANASASAMPAVTNALAAQDLDREDLLRLHAL